MDTQRTTNADATKEEKASPPKSGEKKPRKKRIKNELELAEELLEKFIPQLDDEELVAETKKLAKLLIEKFSQRKLASFD